MLIMYLVRKTHEQQPFYFGDVICVSMPKMGGDSKGVNNLNLLFVNYACEIKLTAINLSRPGLFYFLGLSCDSGQEFLASQPSFPEIHY